MNPNTYSRIFTHAFAAGLKEARDTDKEGVEIGMEKVCEEIESLMEKLDRDKHTFTLMFAVMCLIEHHITESLDSK